MRFPVRSFRSLFAFLAIACLFGAVAPQAQADAIFLRAGAGLGLLGNVDAGQGGSGLGVTLDIGAAFENGIGWTATGGYLAKSGAKGSAYVIGGGPTVGIESASAQLHAGAMLAYAAYTPIGGDPNGSLAIGPKLNLDMLAGESFAISLGAEVLFGMGDNGFTSTLFTIGPKFGF